MRESMGICSKVRPKPLMLLLGLRYHLFGPSSIPRGN